MAENLREVIQRLKEQNNQMSKKSEAEIIKEEVKKPQSVPKEDEYGDEEEEEKPISRPKLEIPREEVKLQPKQEIKPNPEEIIGSEINILQNNGIFRRELLQNIIGINDSLTLIANALGKLGGLDK